MTTYTLSEDVDLPAHPAAALFPMFPDDELEALAADIQQNGLSECIRTYKGTVLDGRNRIKACRVAGVPVLAEEFEGDDDGACRLVVSLNVHRRHLTPSQLGMLSVELEGYRHGEVGNGRGVDGPSGPSTLVPQYTTAGKANLFGVGTTTIKKANTIDRQGIEPLKAAVRNGHVNITDGQRIALIQDPDKQAQILQKALNKTAHISSNSGDNEWYTPDEYLDAARAVMGGIDLDPATSEVANEQVRAAHIFTEEDDGRLQEWAGRVWMNPPYAQPLIREFCEKLTAEFAAGNVTEACVLINNATETGWFQNLAAVASAGCFPKGRVKFWHPDKVSAPLQGQAVLYLGSNKEKFMEVFKQFGLVCAWAS
jgi:ParB family chromosome partitioning protein